MMKVWSIQIEMIAIHVSHGHGENSSTSGITNSQVVPPMWRQQVRDLRRPDVVRIVLHRRLAEPL